MTISVRSQRTDSMETCPKCSSNRVHRSPLGNPLEKLRGRFTRKRPYRCATCGWRGWGSVHKSHRHRPAGEGLQGPEPDLEALDRELSYRAARRKAAGKHGKKRA